MTSTSETEVDPTKNPKEEFDGDQPTEIRDDVKDVAIEYSTQDHHLDAQGTLTKRSTSSGTQTLFDHNTFPTIQLSPVPYNEKLIETSQIRLSIVVHLSGLDCFYPVFDEELKFFENADVEEIKLKAVVKLLNLSFETIRFYIKKRQFEEGESEGVPVINVLFIFTGILPYLKSYREDYQEVKKIFEKAKAIEQQLEKDCTTYNKIQAGHLKVLLTAWKPSLIQCCIHKKLTLKISKI